MPDDGLPRIRILIAEDETIIRLDLRDAPRGARATRSAPRRRDGERRSRSHDRASLSSRFSTSRCRSSTASRRRGGSSTERPIPIVMLTAYGQEELVARAVEAGRLRLPREAVPRDRTFCPRSQTARARHAELAGAARRRRSRWPRRSRLARSIERAKRTLMEREGSPERRGPRRLRACRPARRACRRGSWQKVTGRRNLRQ
mgnify:CR=1 FL=1